MSATTDFFDDEAALADIASLALFDAGTRASLLYERLEGSAVAVSVVQALPVWIAYRDDDAEQEALVLKRYPYHFARLMKNGNWRFARAMGSYIVADFNLDALAITALVRMKPGDERRTQVGRVALLKSDGLKRELEMHRQHGHLRMLEIAGTGSVGLLLPERASVNGHEVLAMPEAELLPKFPAAALESKRTHYSLEAFVEMAQRTAD